MMDKEYAEDHCRTMLATDDNFIYELSDWLKNETGWTEDEANDFYHKRFHRTCMWIWLTKLDARIRELEGDDVQVDDYGNIITEVAKKSIVMGEASKFIDWDVDELNSHLDDMLGDEVLATDIRYNIVGTQLIADYEFEGGE